MKSINTLIKDVNEVLLLQRRDFADHLSEALVGEVRPRIHAAFNEAPERNTLRLSQMGECCPRSLWASVHRASIREPFPAHAKLKFAYGHLIESLAIALAKAAGHEVTGEQDEVFVDGIRGHRDCVIDGCIVDVKSANSLAFNRIKAKQMEEDIFLRSYLDQLDGYLVGSADDDLVRVKDRAYIWAIDKTLGHMTLYEHKLRRTDNGTPRIVERVKLYKDIVGRDTPPECTCETVKDGESGNIKLGLKASYNSYKHFCFPHVRTFLYSKGPVHLTKVVRLPDVPEIDRNGNIGIG